MEVVIYNRINKSFQFLCSDSKRNEVYSINNEGGISYFFSDKEMKHSMVKTKLLFNSIAQTKRQWKMNALKLVPGYEMSMLEMPVYILKRAPWRQGWDIWKDSIWSFNQPIDSVRFFTITPFSYPCPLISFQKEWFTFVTLMCLEELVLSQFSVNEEWGNLYGPCFYTESLISFWSRPPAHHKKAKWRKDATVPVWLKMCVGWIWLQQNRQYCIVCFKDHWKT